MNAHPIHTETHLCLYREYTTVLYEFYFWKIHQLQLLLHIQFGIEYGMLVFRSMSSPLSSSSVVRHQNRNKKTLCSMYGVCVVCLCIWNKKDDIFTARLKLKRSTSKRKCRLKITQKPFASCSVGCHIEKWGHFTVVIFLFIVGIFRSAVTLVILKWSLTHEHTSVRRTNMLIYTQTLDVYKFVETHVYGFLNPIQYSFRASKSCRNGLFSPAFIAFAHTPHTQISKIYNIASGS